MSTAIEWTDATWNPVTGCTKVSPGCASCYISRTPAFRMTGQRFERGRIPVRLHHDRLDQPLHWRKPRRVFVVSMGDLFHEDVPDKFIDKVWAVMALAGASRVRCFGSSCKHDEYSRGCWHNCEGREQPIHTFQVLTKRPDRMRDYLQRRSEWRSGIIDEATQGLGFEDAGEIAESVGWPLPNVWLGVSVENQRMADERIPLLLETPAAVRFLSCEPLLGPLDVSERLYTWHEGPEHHTFLAGSDPRFCQECGNRQPNSAHGPTIGDAARIDWVIVGGESGPGSAERKLVERCVCKGQKEGHAESWMRVGKDDRGLPLYGGWHPKPQALEWLRSIRDQCQAAGVAYFLKQLGGLTPKSGGRLLDGREWNEMPA